MGQIQCFRISGCRCWFFTGDHGPPHFHAASPDEWEIRVFFLFEPVRFEVKYAVRRMPRGVLQAVLRAARDHRAELLAEWERNQADE